MFYGCAARFVWGLVGNPEDRFSHNEAHLYDDALMELGSHYLFYILGVTPESRLKFVHGKGFFIRPLSHSGSLSQTGLRR